MASTHSRQFLTRRAVNWVPLMFAYAFLYMGRYNLTVAASALGDLMTKEQFGNIATVGSVVYGFSFLISGPLTDRFGGRLAMLWGVGGALFANFGMGLLLYGRSEWGWDVNMLGWMMALYALNMHFQSFGAIAIVTAKAPWFHVHERGRFSTIFGIGITLGIYFAFDWGRDIRAATRAVVNPEKMDGWFNIAPIVRGVFGTGDTGVNQDWWLFFIPAILMGICWVLMLVWLRNTPGEAGHADFDTGEGAISDDGERLPVGKAIVMIFKHPVLRWVCLIEFCSGILRNGIMHWYYFFAGETGIRSDFAITAHWGVSLLICGIIGANCTGWMSDTFFQSRRAPMCGLFYGLMFVATVVIFLMLGSPNPWFVGISAMAMSTAVIGVHGILSGTATADFGGIKNTGIVVGIVDGLVYLGTALQFFVLGRITPKGEEAAVAENWGNWPLFLLPFALIGFLLTLKIWKALPQPRTKAEHDREEDVEHMADVM